MVKCHPFEVLFKKTVRTAYSAETQLDRILPQIARHTADEGLRESFGNLGGITAQHLARLELISRRHDLPLSEKGAPGLGGIIEEIVDILETEDDGLITDVALVALIRKVIRYRLATYRAALSHAEELGWSHAVATMETILDDETEAAATFDEWMSNLCSAAVTGRRTTSSFTLPPRNGRRSTVSF